MLSDRRQLVLRALIEEYIAHALPVGSRKLVEQYGLGFSSATIRNELSALEELGYLMQPHTSAGRIPTDFGYRTFVDDLLGRLGDHEVSDTLKAEMRERASEVDDLIEQTSQALTRLTACLTLVVPPRPVSLAVKLVNVVTITPTHLLLVVIDTDGKVLNRQIELAEPATAEDVAAVQELMNVAFAGSTVSRAGAQPASSAVKRLSVATESVKALFAKVVDELFSCIEDATHVKTESHGVTNLLGQPEFSNSVRLLPILQQLEDDTMLLQVFDEAIRSDAPIVRIGHENNAEALSGVSLVASRYGEGANMGLVAIVGPTRMDYSLVFEAVRAAKDVLGGR